MIRQNEEEGTPPWLRAGSGRPAKIRSVLDACLLSPPHFVTASLNALSPIFLSAKPRIICCGDCRLQSGGLVIVPGGGGGGCGGEHENGEAETGSGRIGKQLLWAWSRAETRAKRHARPPAVRRGPAKSSDPPSTGEAATAPGASPGAEPQFAQS
ncbi:hypothetical protein NL676_034300 [Syzygium grande]|nr:hypothetical protein NL676_034300 [Syzygium grande]